MTSHDAMIQTMSHLSAFVKATAKLLLFFELTKFFHEKSTFFSKPTYFSPIFTVFLSPQWVVVCLCRVQRTETSPV